MSIFALMINPAVHFIIATLLMQGMYGDFPPENVEDPFARATTPPNEFLVFNEDFMSRDFDRFMKWINPALGIVANGVLLTKEEAETQFGEVFYGGDRNSLQEINFAFNYGEFAGANTFQADCWMEMKLRDGGSDDWFRMHYQLVFQIIAGSWYLVQWEYIPPDVNLPLGYEDVLSSYPEVPDQFKPYILDSGSTTTSLGLASVWPLLIGTNYTSETELHPLEGVTPGRANWTLAHAVTAEKPTVLYFFSVHGLSVLLPEDFDEQMEFLEGLYDLFGYDDLYIYGVTDDVLEDLEWLAESGYDKFAPLLDEGSEIHAALNINVHPYIVVFNSEGTVVALTGTYHPSSLNLIEDRIRDAINDVD
jgi:hypothetical protein